NTLNLAAAHIFKAQFDMVAAVIDMEGVAAIADFDGGALGEILTQDLFEIRLVEAEVRAPAMRADFLRTRPVEQKIARAIDKAHARMGGGQWLDLFGNADPLENAHHL